MEVLAFERTLTELDHVRLTHLVHRHKAGRRPLAASLPIEHLLDEAIIVPCQQVPPDVVTMHSRVLLEDLQTGVQSQFTLCYPPDADALAGQVSVLSPVGWSLLGQQVGATVVWSSPAGGTLSAKVLGMAFQPEASGDFVA